MDEWMCVEFWFFFNMHVGVRGKKSKHHIEYRKINWRFQINLILNFPYITLFSTVICRLVGYEPVFLSSQEGIDRGRYLNR